MKTKNGRAVKTSGGTVFVQTYPKATAPNGKRNAWAKCGAVYTQGTRSRIWDWNLSCNPNRAGGNKHTRRAAAIACAEAYEAEVLDKPKRLVDVICGTGLEPVIVEFDHPEHGRSTPFPVTMEKQDDERDAEAYVYGDGGVNQRLPNPCSRSESIGFIYNAFIAGRESAR